MRVALTILLAVGLSCCASWTYTPLNGPASSNPPRAPESIEVFTTERPARRIIEIGQFALPDGASADDGLMRQLRKEASAKGCDALVLVSASPLTYHCVLYLPP